jgi:methionine-rich copper-binding protein CopC
MLAHRPRRSVAAVAIAWLGLLIAPGVALAHAELDTVTPKDKGTVPAPTQIVMTFTENLNPSGSNIRLVDASNAVIAQGGTVDPSTPKQMTLDLSATPLAPGAYTIRWTSTSALDGDVARGTTTFTATAATAPPASPSAAPSAPSAEPSVADSPSPAASPTGISSDAPVASGSDTSGGSGSTSGTDAIVPIVVGVAVLGGLGWWLLRGRSRSAS